MIMSMLPQVFKPSDVKGEELLKDGKYVGQVTKSEMKDTKAGTGKYLALHIKVLEAEEQDDVGRLVFVNFNLVNPNPQAVAIAEREFKQLCEAIGLDEVEDSQELHAIPFCMTIGTQAGQGDFPDSNTVKKYEAEAEYK